MLHCYLIAPCTCLGRRLLAHGNFTLENIFIFSSLVSWEHYGWLPPKMKQKPSDTYHPLHFTTQTLFAAHFEFSTGLPLATIKQMCSFNCSVSNVVFLCMFQMERWRWRRRAWSSAPWGQGRCLESWLFSTTAPGPPLSRVSLRRHS